MSDTPEPGLQAARHEVQRRLGACLLGLQACEQAAKAILSAQEVHSVSGAAPVDRSAHFARMTLGQLVEQLFGRYLVDAEPPGDPDSPATDTLDAVTTRFHLILSPKAHARAEAALRDFVQVRNRMVHHFLEDHDLHTKAGCLRAGENLGQVLDRITICHRDLRDWAKGLDDIRKALAEAIASDALRQALAEGAATPGPHRA